MRAEFEATPIPLPPGASAASVREGLGARLLVAAGATRPRRVPLGCAGALRAQDAAEPARRLLLDAPALAVTTGQQPGLFTGPLYTIYKALTAAALAEALGECGFHPVVPVFWVAGDDHDFRELASCAVLRPDNSLARLVLRQRAADAPLLSAYAEVLGEEVDGALAALEAALPASEFRPATLEWLRRCYRPEETLAGAGAAALAELLGRSGVVVVEGWHPAVKRAAEPIVLGALEHAAELDRALAEEAGRLRALGHRPPVEVGQGLALVMLDGAQGRDRLRIVGPGRFETRRSGERFTLDELREVASAEPERLSANVLLRPVVEASVFPVVAYAGGPSELGYLPQAAPLFAHFGLSQPVPVPRFSGLVVEAKVAKITTKLGWRAAEFAAPASALASRAVRDALPAEASEALAALREAVDAAFSRLIASGTALDPTVRRPIQEAHRHSRAAADSVERRLVATLKRANDTIVEQIEKAHANLFPDGEPQERVLTVATYLARYGRAFLEAARVAARAHVEAFALEGSGGGA